MYITSNWHKNNKLHIPLGEWSEFTECSVTCGNGTKVRTRSCVIDCENGTIETKECYSNMTCCPGNEIKCYDTVILL